MKKIKSLIIVMLLLVMIAFSGCSNIATSKGKNADKTDDDILSVLSDNDSYYSDVFEGNKISDVNVQISEDDFNDLCENAVQETYYNVDITVNDTTVKNVGFRAKGNSTLTSVANSDSNRYGFKIKFDKYTDGQTLNGLDMMVLNSSFADPSYMREYLAYAATQHLDGITPFVTYTRLSINGEYYGLYLTIEAYKDSFVSRNTDDENAVLYKADSENCTLLTSDNANGFDVECGSDDEKTNIKNLIEILDKTTSDNTEEIESILDVDSVLKAAAVNFITGNYDSYSGSKAHNYYLLYSNGKFEYIGWDYNMAFGGFSDDGGASVTVSTDSPFYNVNAENRPLMSKLLAIEKYYDKYLSYVDSLKEFFGDFSDKINTIADFIRQDVQTDPTAFYTIEQFENNITESDTDLSQVQNKPGKGNKGDDSNLQLPDGVTLPDIQNGQSQDGQSGQRPELPDGVTLPDIQNGQSQDGQSGQRPELPDGVTPPDIQNGQSQDGQSGQRPELSDGVTPPDIQNGQSQDGQSGQRPELPDGVTPPDIQNGNGNTDKNMGQNNDKNQIKGGGGMINTNTISIYDYINQHLKSIG